VGPDLASKRILVLSDDDRLARAIEVNLNNPTEMEVARLAPPVFEGRESRSGINDFDLLVVAASSPNCEPVVVLAQASVAERIGQVPLLIISDRSFYPDPGTMIAHLSFPFGAEELTDKVRELLLWG
jgi:hypothetical protein